MNLYEEKNSKWSRAGLTALAMCSRAVEAKGFGLSYINSQYHQRLPEG
jgi:hypothetical protein